VILSAIYPESIASETVLGESSKGDLPASAEGVEVCDGVDSSSSPPILRATRRAANDFFMLDAGPLMSLD